MQGSVDPPQTVALLAVSPSAFEGRAYTWTAVTVMEPSDCDWTTVAPYWVLLSHCGVPVGGEPSGAAAHSRMFTCWSLGRKVFAGTLTVMVCPLANGLPAVNGACATAAWIWSPEEMAPAIPVMARKKDVESRMRTPTSQSNPLRCCDAFMPLGMLTPVRPFNG